MGQLREHTGGAQKAAVAELVRSGHVSAALQLCQSAVPAPVGFLSARESWQGLHLLGSIAESGVISKRCPHLFCHQVRPLTHDRRMPVQAVRLLKESAAPTGVTVPLNESLLASSTTSGSAGAPTQRPSFSLAEVCTPPAIIPCMPVPTAVAVRHVHTLMRCTACMHGFICCFKVC